MKLLAAGLVLALALTAAAQTTPKAKAGTTPAAPAVKKDEQKKKEEPPPPMEGQIVERGTLGFLGVQVKGGVFVVKFYDAKKKAKTPDLGQLALRWEPKNKSITERTLLMPGGGPNAMTSAKVVQPPLLFKLYLTALAENGDATGETYAIDFRQ